MRFYDIDLSDVTTGKQVLPSSLGGNRLTSLLRDGSKNPAALNIEFDIPVVNYTPGAENKEGYLRIWGLGLADLTSAFNLTPTVGTGVTPSYASVNVKISAGMSAGLPLANPKQQGLIMSGSILQAWGNWLGTDQTLDMRFAPAAGSASDPLNFPFTWGAGTQLSTAIGQTLAVAMPRFKQVIAIKQNIVLPNDEVGVYQSLTQFTDYINGISKFVVGGDYLGVNIASDGSTVYAWDGTVPVGNVGPKQIAFQDMVGQPMWEGPLTISVKLVLRGDLNMGDVIKMPESLTTQTQQSYLNFRDKSSFTGFYEIVGIQHFGNFRQPDAASWNTTITAVNKVKK